MSRPMDAEPMTFERFMSQMLKPTYVWRMAWGLMPHYIPEDARTPLQRGAVTRIRNAQRRIDDLVLARAAQIADERRCGAMTEIDNPKGAYIAVRCEFQRGHGPVGPGPHDRTAANVLVKRDWDHGNSKAGKWWMEPKESDA